MVEKLRDIVRTNKALQRGLPVPEEWNRLLDKLIDDTSGTATPSGR